MFIQRHRHRPDLGQRQPAGQILRRVVQVQGHQLLPGHPQLQEKVGRLLHLAIHLLIGPYRYLVVHGDIFQKGRPPIAAYSLIPLAAQGAATHHIRHSKPTFYTAEARAGRPFIDSPENHPGAATPSPPLPSMGASARPQSWGLLYISRRLLRKAFRSMQEPPYTNRPLRRNRRF